MQVEAGKQIQARPYERTGKRIAHRNETRPRSFKTIHGEIELDKPQIREFPFQTKVFERYPLFRTFSSSRNNFRILVPTALEL